MHITGIHPYADKFPMLPPSEHEELRESVRSNGLRNPIVLDRDGRVIDGRNRYKACQDIGVEPDVIVYDGDDIAEYVIDCNVTRRNMSTGARAMATALVLAHDGRRENGRWRRGSVANGQESISDASAWVKAMKWAGTVLDFKPDLAESVVTGDITLNDAFEQAKAIKDSAERDKILAREKAKREKNEAQEEAERNARIIADLNQAGADYYLEQVNNGDMKPVSAWAAYRAEHKKELDRLAAERRNDEEQARMVCRTLEGLEFLDYDTQREWCITSTAQYPDAVPTRQLGFHTPERIRHYADMLHTYASELESSNAA